MTILKNKLSISFLIFFTVCAFYPDLQLYIAYVNGALIAMIENWFSLQGLQIIYPTNLIFSLIFIYLFSNTRKSYTRITTAIFYAFFMSSFVLFLGQEFINQLNNHHLRLLIIGLIVCSPLFLIENLQNKNSPRKAS